VVETQFTVVALIDDAMMVGGRQLGDVALVDVDSIEQGVEGRAQIETAAAPVADLVDPQCLFVQLGRLDRIDKTKRLHGRADRSTQPPAISYQP
jgi:hypothetical protein